MKFYLLLLLLALGLFSSCSKKAASSSSAYALKTADFPAFIANPGTLNIVDFSATWCPPCQQLKPVLESLAKEHSDTVRLGIVDVDDEKSLAAQQGVRGIPDVRFYIDGNLVDKFTGSAPKEHIEQLIAKHSKNLIPIEAEVTPPDLPAQPVPPAQPNTPEQPSSPAPDPTIQPTQPSAPAQPNPPTQTPSSPAPTAPTIIPSKENPLPPGMSKQ